MGVAVEGFTLDIEVGSTVGSIEGKADGTVVRRMEGVPVVGMTVGSNVGSIVDGR